MSPASPASPMCKRLTDIIASKTLSEQVLRQRVSEERERNKRRLRRGTREF
jgi:hypothetical protein